MDYKQRVISCLTPHLKEKLDSPELLIHYNLNLEEINYFIKAWYAQVETIADKEFLEERTLKLLTQHYKPVEKITSKLTYDYTLNKPFTIASFCYYIDKLIVDDLSEFIREEDRVLIKNKCNVKKYIFSTIINKSPLDIPCGNLIFYYCVSKGILGSSIPIKTYTPKDYFSLIFLYKIAKSLGYKESIHRLKRVIEIGDILIVNSHGSYSFNSPPLRYWLQYLSKEYIIATKLKLKRLYYQSIINNINYKKDNSKLIITSLFDKENFSYTQY